MKIIKMFIFVFVVFIVGGCFYSIGNNDYALKINDEKISVGEYNMYLYEQKKMFEEKGGKDIWETDFDGSSAKDVAKQNAINSLVLVKTALKQSENLNIVLTDEDIENVTNEANKFIKDVGAENLKELGLKSDDVRKIIKESYIQQKVYDFVTGGFELSEVDFKSYFDNYYESHKKELNIVKIRYIFIKDDENNKEKVKENVDMIYAQVLVGEDFSKLQDKYSDSNEKDVIVFENGKFNSDIEDIVYKLSKNEVSDIIQTGEGYYIIKAVDIITPNMSELEIELKEYYIQEKKQEIYANQSEKWSANVTVEKNKKVWNEINVPDID